MKKVLAWRSIASWSHAGHVPGRQECNTLALSAQARAWLAHGACKFYRCEKSYSISSRQLPPPPRAGTTGMRTCMQCIHPCIHAYILTVHAPLCTRKHYITLRCAAKHDITDHYITSTLHLHCIYITFTLHLHYI